MAFEDLQKAFIEADLEKIREKSETLKSKNKPKLATGKNVAKGKKKSTNKKLALTKDSAKSKDKARLEELEKLKLAKAQKEAEIKEAQKDKDTKEKALPLNSSLPSDIGINKSTDVSLYQQKFYLPEDKERVSGLDQLEAINKLPVPEDKTLPKEEKERPTQEKQKNAPDRFKQLRDTLGAKGVSAPSLVPPKTPITEKVKVAKEAAAKDSVASMDAILALHSNKKSK